MKYYGQLLKCKLSITVVFSAIAGYLLGIENFNPIVFSQLVVGGFFVTGAANALNQILERKHDKFMERTAVRPLPMGNLSVVKALVFAMTLGALGVYILNQINSQGSFFGLMSKSAAFGLLSMGIYVLGYTPLKRISPFAITVGAIPGAIPFLLGFVAATDDFGFSAGVLFALQFFWQYPHFIAISWVLDEEYKKAGFKMMIGGEKGRFPAFIGVITCVLTTLISIIPYFWGTPVLSLSVYGFAIVFVLGVWFTLKALKLYQNSDDGPAKQLMLSSFVYLPLIQTIYMLDKFLIQ